jgi:hypothetical protein
LAGLTDAVLLGLNVPAAHAKRTLLEQDSYLRNFTFVDDAGVEHTCLLNFSVALYERTDGSRFGQVGSGAAGGNDPDPACLDNAYRTTWTAYYEEGPSRSGELGSENTPYITSVFEDAINMSATHQVWFRQCFCSTEIISTSTK